MNRLAAVLVGPLLLAVTHLRAEVVFDFGPFASRVIDAGQDDRFRALGPLVESACSPSNQTLRTIRPLHASAVDPVRSWKFNEWIWPLAATAQLRNQRATRVLLAYHRDMDVTDYRGPYRLAVIPLYFQGRDDDYSRYWALFPVGGSIHDFLFQDEINFVLWPLHHTIRQGEVRSSTWLWPIYSRTHGKGISRFRVFPFYGRSRQRNDFEKKFILWPFWTASKFYQPSRGRGFILFPLYGRINLDDQDSWLVLPPFFRYAKGERLNLLYAPWPFFQRSWGETDKLYVWPLYGYRRTTGFKSSFLVWPFFQKETVDRGDTVVRRSLVLPLYFSEKQTARKSGGQKGREIVARKSRFWPLWYYQREGEHRRFRMLSLWPLRQSPRIERQWAPLWTLYDDVRVADNADTELLWGMYRSQRRGEEYCYRSVFPLWASERRLGDTPERSWSVLKGLVGYDRDSTQRTLRLLYFLRIPVGESKP